ncbi:MAG: hypothetical protein KDC07_02555 [Chitinophagaceae bacterium]|nr:hypothetical protein [Chitinophagaceae bacterium]
MRKPLILLSLTLAFCSPARTDAQTMSITKASSLAANHSQKQESQKVYSFRVGSTTAAHLKDDNNYKIKTADVCYDKAYLSAISDTMFRQGNPKYIWVDLLIDGYVHDGDMDWYNVYINTEGNSNGGNTNIPEETRTAYAEKWIRFVYSLHEPLSKYGSYNMNNINPISVLAMIDPASDFRKVSKSELHFLRLTCNGELRFYMELIKDGIATPDKPLNLDLSSKGFYVYGKRLTREQREKYMNLCEQEFGSNYFNDGSRYSRGPLPENTLAKDIAELTDRIKAADKVLQTAE